MNMAGRIAKATVGALLLFAVLYLATENVDYVVILIGGAVGAWAAWRWAAARHRPTTEWTLAVGGIIGAFLPLAISALWFPGGEAVAGRLGEAIGAGVVGGLFVGGGIALVTTAAKGPATKECPFCAERILTKATVCKHCGRDVTPPAASA